MKQLTHFGAVLVAVGLLAVSSTAFASGGTGGGGGTGGTQGGVNPCVMLGVSTNPTSMFQPSPNSTITVNSAVTNCSSQAETVLIVFHFSGNSASCMQDLTPSTVTLTLKPGETQGISFNRPAPQCSGLYFAVGGVYDPVTFMPLTQSWAFWSVTN